MKEFKGAPGKWKADETGVYTDANIVGIIVCISPETKNFRESAKYWPANARLIAAAPEMMEVLQELIELKKWKDKHGKDDHYLRLKPAIWEKAKSLIDKTIT